MRGDVVARAMRLIADGAVDREGVTGLAGRVGYTADSSQRLLQAELGADPLALARPSGPRPPAILIETTDLAFSDVAFAAGFSSIRQFNDTIRAVCDLHRRRSARRATPSSTAATPVPAGALSLRLPVRTPFAYEGAVRSPRRLRGSGRRRVRDGRIPTHARDCPQARHRQSHTANPMT